MLIGAIAPMYIYIICYNWSIESGGSMKVIKRDVHMVEWCPDKIEEAIMKANLEVEEEEKASSIQIKNIIK